MLQCRSVTCAFCAQIVLSETQRDFCFGQQPIHKALPPGAADLIMLDEAGLVARLLSIQHNKGVGYDVSAGYQVLNAIMQSSKSNKRWDSLYAIAVKAYELGAHFTAGQARKCEGWRQTLITKVADQPGRALPAPSSSACPLRNLCSTRTGRGTASSLTLQSDRAPAVVFLTPDRSEADALLVNT